jgi:hypothetical protein
MKTEDFFRVVTQQFYINHEDTKRKLYTILREVSDLKVFSPSLLYTYGERIFAAITALRPSTNPKAISLRRFLKYIFIVFFTDEESVTGREAYLVLNSLRRNDLTEFDSIFFRSDGSQKWEMLDPNKRYGSQNIFNLHDPQYTEITDYLLEQLEIYLESVFEARFDRFYMALVESYRKSMSRPIADKSEDPSWMLGGKRKKKGTRKRRTKLNKT